MTDAKLLDKARSQAKVVTEWEAKIQPKVRKAVGKAYAHGIIALTERLKQAPAGRSSLRVVGKSRSYVAACDDLKGLWRSLCGPSSASLDGWLRDARESLYRASFAWWRDNLPESHAVAPDTAPPQARVREVRGLILHGYELRNEIGPKVLKAQSDLSSALERASKPDVLSATAVDILLAWSDAARNSLLLSVQTSLSDSAVAVQSIALVDAIRPEFRPSDGIAPE